MGKWFPTKPYLTVRMREEDRQLVQKIAEYFDISEADVVKMAIKEFAKKHGLEKVEVDANK